MDKKKKEASQDRTQDRIHQAQTVNLSVNLQQFIFISVGLVPHFFGGDFYCDIIGVIVATSVHSYRVSGHSYSFQKDQDMLRVLVCSRGYAIRLCIFFLRIEVGVR